MDVLWASGILEMCDETVSSWVPWDCKFLVLSGRGLCSAWYKMESAAWNCVMADRLWCSTGPSLGMKETVSDFAAREEVKVRWSSFCPCGCVWCWGICAGVSDVESLLFSCRKFAASFFLLLLLSLLLLLMWSGLLSVSYTSDRLRLELGGNWSTSLSDRWAGETESSFRNEESGRELSSSSSSTIKKKKTTHFCVMTSPISFYMDIWMIVWLTEGAERRTDGWIECWLIK